MGGIHVVDHDISVICKKWAYIMDNNTLKVVRNGNTKETFITQRDDANIMGKEDFLDLHPGQVPGLGCGQTWRHKLAIFVCVSFKCVDSRLDYIYCFSSNVCECQLFGQ